MGKDVDACIMINREFLRISHPLVESRFSADLKSLKFIQEQRGYLIASKKTFEIASDIDTLFKSLHPDSISDYRFACFWTGEKFEPDTGKLQEYDKALDDQALFDTEKLFKLTLPPLYKDRIVAYSSRDRPNVSVNERIHTRKRDLLNANRRVRENFPYSKVWNKNWFVIGTDGFGNDLFIIGNQHSDTVYEFDHEQVLDENYNPLEKPIHCSVDKLLNS